MRDTNDPLQRLRDRLHLLADTTCAFAESDEEHPRLIENLTRRVADAMGDLCGVWLASDDGAWVSCVGLHDAASDALAKLQPLVQAPVRAREFPLVGCVLERREAVLAPEFDPDDGELPAGARALLASMGARSVLVVPLRARRRAVGAMVLVRHGPDRDPYDEDDWDFAQTLADHVALAVTSGSLVATLQAELAERTRAENALARSEELLRHSHKMEAVGRLAGGVAHGFNNVLSVVLSYADIILAELAPDDPMRPDVVEIRRAGQQASDLTRQLLAFSRKQVLRLRPVGLNDVIAGIESMLRTVLGNEVELTLTLADDLWPVRADAGQIEQVIMNLAANAHDAMPLGGRFTLETRNVEVVDDPSAPAVDLTPGPHALLTVSDTGHGMDRVTIDRIFEPFFTTKARGRSVGFGLSTVFGIVRQCGGHIRVFSEPGMGTTFRLYFPRTDADAAVRRRAHTPSIEAAAASAITVLLVEDDAQVRAVVRDILARAGHRVLEASSPADALAIAGHEGARVHLLLTDVVMPDLSGPQLAQRIAALHPAMRVLFMSGYTHDTVSEHGLTNTSADFLEKPITPAGLTRKLREMFG